MINPKLRCATYIRVSTKLQTQESSLVNQKNLLSNYIDTHNWTLYEHYSDICSGTLPNRRGLNKLMHDANQSKFDVLLFKDISRPFRNELLGHTIKDSLTKNKIHIISLDGCVNTFESSMNYFGIFLALAANESKNTSRRIKATKNLLAKKGFFIGSIPPYGYTLKNGQLLKKDDFTTDTIKRIFKEYLGGKGFDTIAKSLYNDNIPTPSIVANKKNASTRWHGSSVRILLTNPHYYGGLVQNRTTRENLSSNTRTLNSKLKMEILENTHEPIISKTDFELVQHRIEKRKISRTTQTTHLFTPFLKCNTCSNGLIFKKNRKGYICSSYNKLGKKACTHHLVLEEDLIDIIKNDIKANLVNANFQPISKKVIKKTKTALKKLNDNISSLNSKKETLIRRKKLTFESFQDKVISKDEFIEYKNIYNSELETLKIELESKQALLNSNFSKQIQLKYQIAKETFQNMESLNHEILTKFVKEIIVIGASDIKIIYHFEKNSN